jgi:hypothetical protein
MELTKQEFDRLRLPQNHVLVKPNFNNGKYKLASGHEIYLTADPNSPEHFAVTAEVVRLPEKLVSDGHKDNMRWGTEVEVQIGDTVWCNSFNLMDVLGELEFAEDFVLTCEGVNYVPLHYSYIYAAKRGDQIIPLNGYCLIEPVVNYIHESILIIPEHLKTQESKFVGMVRHMGIPNRWYYEEERDFSKKVSGDEAICDGLQIDNLVIVRDHKNTLLEKEGYETIDGTKRLWRVQYRDIYCVLPSNEAIVTENKPEINTTKKVKK